MKPVTLPLAGLVNLGVAEAIVVVDEVGKLPISVPFGPVTLVVDVVVKLKPGLGLTPSTWARLPLKTVELEESAEAPVALVPW